jgi:hypothetical protein
MREACVLGKGFVTGCDTLYLQISDNIVGPMNMTCWIEPQLLEVEVNYTSSANGNIFSILNYTPQTTPQLPINTSTAVNSVIAALQDHLSKAQTSNDNFIVDAIAQFYSQNAFELSPDFSAELLELMVGSLHRGKRLVNIFDKIRLAISRV